MPVAFGPDGLVVHLERDELDVPTLVVSRVEVRSTHNQRMTRKVRTWTTLRSNGRKSWS